MNAVLFPAGLLAAAAGVGYYWLESYRREHVRGRLTDAEVDAPSEQVDRPFAVRHRWLCWTLAAALTVVLLYLFSTPYPIAVGLGFVTALLALEVDAWILEWRQSRIETQLADTIDVLVASLGAGSSLQTSLAQAAEFTPMPLRRELEDMVARLRLGDSPKEVFNGMQDRVPMETFRLFATSLSVNWEAGGGLSETLAAVGSTIRDRLNISRQFRALSTQGRLTTLTVLLVTWFMAAMMWQADPPRFLRFLFSEVGVWLIGGTLFLQGIGVALVSRISRPKV